MAAYPTMRTTFRCWAPGSVEEVEARLEYAIDRGDLDGTVRDGEFHVTRPISGTRNSWRPQMKGTLTEAGGGVLIETKLAVTPSVAMFTLIHGLFLFGVSWLLGVIAFSSEVPGATEALAGAVEAELVGDDVEAKQALSDPEDPGAATGAPWSFRARARVDEVRFTIRGASAWGGLAPANRLALTVGPEGATIDPVGSPPIVVPWGALAACTVEAGNLMILRVDAPPIEIGAAAHSPRDLEWMAAFLTARASDRAGLEVDERAQLARISARQLQE